MTPSKHNNNLDELITGSISRPQPKFDFDKWKQNHQEEIQHFKTQKPVKPAGLSIWRNLMHTRITKFATAAAVLIVIFGVSEFFPFSSQIDTSNKQWWLGPSSACAQEIIAELDKIKGVTCRERTIILLSDGSENESSTWDIFYVSEDSYRRDIYDGDQLREIQWYIPDKDGKTIQTGFRHDTKTYFTSIGGGSFGNSDPISRMRFYVDLLDKADRVLSVEEFEGHECVGFEISADKYGNNPPEWIDRIWFDVETKLPIRIEKHGHHFTGRPDMKYYKIKDKFDYNPDLPADTFVPWYPEGYIFAHPDDIRSEEDKNTDE